MKTKPTKASLYEQAERERRERNRTKFWREKRYAELLVKAGYEEEGE